jgi:hypothetical protein
MEEPNKIETIPSREEMHKSDVTEYEMISKLQIKKNKLRKLLKEKGILVKGAHNDFDDYEYFSEAQYKELFTELLSECDLELDSTEINVQNIDGTDKQKFGVFVTIEFILTDVETGYSIRSTHSGIGFDKGDKALYKAKTGAIKYFFATTFLVATKDDPERDDNDKKFNKNVNKVEKNSNKTVMISDNQKALIQRLFKDSVADLNKILQSYGKKKVDELSIAEASEVIKSKKEGNK